MYRLSSSNLIRKGLARVHLFVLSLRYRYALCSTRYADKTAPTFLWITATHKCNIARPDNHIKGTPKHTMGMNPMICLGKKSNPTQEVPYETIIRGFRPAQQQQFGRNH